LRICGWIWPRLWEKSLQKKCFYRSNFHIEGRDSQVAGIEQKFFTRVEIRIN